MIPIFSYDNLVNMIKQAHTNLLILSSLTIILLIPSVLISQTTIQFEDITERSTQKKLEKQVFDGRYSPISWQSSIGLPDDPHKTVVRSDGELKYDFNGNNLYGWENEEKDFFKGIKASLVRSNEYTPGRQYLLNSKVPVVITESKVNNILFTQKAWARAPEHSKIDDWAPRRVDYLLLNAINLGKSAQKFQIKLEITSDEKLEWIDETLVISSNPKEKVLSVDPTALRTEVLEDSVNTYNLFFEPKTLSAGETDSILVTMHTAKFAQPYNRDPEMYDQYHRYHEKALEIAEKTPTSVKRADKELKRAIHYWKTDVTIPYNKIKIPDSNLQRLLDSSIRNVLQARELKNGEPVFQVGPSHYRGSWAADGPFFLEAFTYLGHEQEVRKGLEQQVDADTGPGGKEFSKKAGLRLWMIWRHAELTGDREWLNSMWPKVERDVNLIKKYREMSRNDETTKNDGLMPEGFGDGGLGGKHHEYTNVYWTLSGLKSAVRMAEWLNKPVSGDWKSEYSDYWNSFEKAANRDKLTDAFGNTYIPPTMRGEEPQLPQRGAWAFLHSVFPGQIYENDHTLMRGMMDMLDANQSEGLIYGTGWLAHGIWNYAASFYAHAHLWLGNGKKAASTLYAFANHANPVLTWVEEQYPVSQLRGEHDLGDAPHNWASSEFIRLIRHLMILERGNELHLLEGLPKAWTKPANTTNFNDIHTAFGKMSLDLTMADDGQSVNINIVPPKRTPPDKIVIHLDNFEQPVWSVQTNGSHLIAGESIELEASKPLSVTINFKHKAEQRYSHPQDN